MLVLNTTQVAAMSDGSVPEGMRGTIKKVWPRAETQKQAQYVKPGESNVGSLQKLIVTDGTTELQVMIDGRDAIPASVAGSSILLTTFKGDRGPTGLKRKDNTYNGITTPQLWVYRAGDIVVEGGGSGGAQQPQPTQQANNQQPRQQASAPVQRPQTNGATNGHQPAASNGLHPPANGHANGGKKSATPADRANAIRDYNRALAKASSAYERCFDAAFQMVKRLDARHGFKPEASTIEKIAACLMVQSCWGSKPAQIEAFPMRHFDSYDKAGVEIPTQAEEPKANGGRGQQQGAPFTA